MENQELKESDIHYEHPKWKEMGTDILIQHYRSFQQEGEPIVVHIIKTGYADTYIVTIEDGYDMAYFDSKIRSKQDIINNFGIYLDI
jgi:hypothetical protein